MTPRYMMLDKDDHFSIALEATLRHSLREATFTQAPHHCASRFIVQLTAPATMASLVIVHTFTLLGVCGW